jgi:hypothetical protein
MIRSYSSKIGVLSYGRLALQGRRDSPYEILALTANLLIGRAAYETARRMFPGDRIDYRNGAQIIARSDQERG